MARWGWYARARCKNTLAFGVDEYDTGRELGFKISAVMMRRARRDKIVLGCHILHMHIKWDGRLLFIRARAIGLSDWCHVSRNECAPAKRQPALVGLFRTIARRPTCFTVSPHADMIESALHLRKS